MIRLLLDFRGFGVFVFLICFARTARISLIGINFERVLSRISYKWNILSIHSSHIPTLFH